MESEVLRSADQERRCGIVEADDVRVQRRAASLHAGRANTQTRGIHGVVGPAEIHRHLSVGCIASPACIRDQVGIKGTPGVEQYVGCLPVDFRQQPLIFVVQRGAAARECGRSRFRRKRSQAVNDVGNIIEPAINDLQRTHPVVGVQHPLREFGRVTPVFIGDGKACGVVGRGIDPVPRRKLIDCLSLKVRIDADVVLGDERSNVGLN